MSDFHQNAIDCAVKVMSQSPILETDPSVINHNASVMPTRGSRSNIISVEGEIPVVAGSRPSGIFNSISILTNGPTAPTGVFIKTEIDSHVPNGQDIVIGSGLTEVGGELGYVETKPHQEKIEPEDVLNDVNQNDPAIDQVRDTHDQISKDMQTCMGVKPVRAPVSRPPGLGR